MTPLLHEHGGFCLFIDDIVGVNVVVTDLCVDLLDAEAGHALHKVVRALVKLCRIRRPCRK